MKNQIDWAILLTYLLLISELIEHLSNIIPSASWIEVTFLIGQLLAAIWILKIVASTTREQLINWTKTAKGKGMGIFARTKYLFTSYYDEKLSYLLGYFNKSGSDLTIALLTPLFSVFSTLVPMIADRIF